MNSRLLFLLVVCYAGSLWCDNVFKVQGASEPVQQNIRLYLSQLAKTPSLTNWQVEELSLDALKALGFYHPTVNVSINGSQVSIHVREGVQVKIVKSEITIEGEASSNQSFKEAVTASGLGVGEPLNHGNYESLKSTLSDLALKQGYFDAEWIRSELQVSEKHNQAIIVIHFNSGKRYHFGKTFFTGSQINLKKLRTMVPYQEGEPYLAEQVGLLNQRLSNVGWFSSVYAGGSIDEKEDFTIPVKVLVVPEVKNKMETGIGYTTSKGPRLKLKWRKPWINSAGHSINIQSELSQYEPTLLFAYKLPLLDVLHDYYQITGGIRYIDTHDTLSTDLLGGIERHWMLGDWDQSLFFRWLYEDYKQGAHESGVANMGMVGISYSHAYFSKGAVPKNAQKRFISLGYSNPILGADAPLWDLRARQGWIRTLAENHRAIMKVEAGGTFADDVQSIPPALRYFIGGDNSIRGYRYQSVSPHDDTNQQIGGKYMATTSVEYQYRLVGNFWGAAFYDVGSSWNKTFDLKRGTGIGVRWASPVGSIRLDVGWGVDRPGTPFEIHLMLGPEL